MRYAPTCAALQQAESWNSGQVVSVKSGATGAKPCYTRKSQSSHKDSETYSRGSVHAKPAEQEWGSSYEGCVHRRFRKRAYERYNSLNIAGGAPLDLRS